MRLRMKTVSFFVLLAATPLLAIESVAVEHQHRSIQGLRCGRRCGVERWEIKTLSDPERDRVNRRPVRTSVRELAELPRPRSTPSYSRIYPTEFTTFQVDAYLGGWRAESDGDMHLFLFDPNDQRVSLIGEIPDPNCGGACASGLTEEFAKARAVLGDILQQSNPEDQPLLVRVTGVGFFDRNHRQIAAAPNYIELHPVSSLQQLSPRRIRR